MRRTYGLKSIPTVFNKVIYKSRLEARWAVFFDKLGVEAFYEYEGFQLRDGWYVPDFYVPSMNAWFEVKPTEFTYHESQLLYELGEATGRRVVFLSGDMVYRDPEDHNGLGGFECDCDEPYFFCVCPHCFKVGIEFDGRGARVCGDKCLPDQDKGYSADNWRLIDAFNYASKFQFNEWMHKS